MPARRLSCSLPPRPVLAGAQFPDVVLDRLPSIKPQGPRAEPRLRALAYLGALLHLHSGRHELRVNAGHSMRSLSTRMKVQARDQDLPPLLWGLACTSAIRIILACAVSCPLGAGKGTQHSVVLARCCGLMEHSAILQSHSCMQSCPAQCQLEYIPWGLKAKHAEGEMVVPHNEGAVSARPRSLCMWSCVAGGRAAWLPGTLLQPQPW